MYDKDLPDDIRDYVRCIIETAVYFKHINFYYVIGDKHLFPDSE